MKLFTDELSGQDFAIIEHEDGSTTAMLKTTYDDLKANEAQAI
jgi:hypothetical protein